MHFSHLTHHDNYIKLMEMYGLTPFTKFIGDRFDPQYEASIYIAAYPNLFDLIDFNTLDLSCSPLFHFMTWNGKDEDDPAGEHVPNHPGLTGSTTRLVQFGLSLYNGYLVSLDHSFGDSDHYFEIYIQAMKIRAGRE